MTGTVEPRHAKTMRAVRHKMKQLFDAQVRGQMRYRLKKDFRLSLITLMGICAAPSIVVMAWVRYAEGSNLGAILDLGIVLFIIAVVVQAWRSEDTRLCGLVTSVGICSGTVAAVMINGLGSLLWLYPCFMVSFFFVSRPSIAFLILVSRIWSKYWCASVRYTRYFLHSESIFSMSELTKF